LIRAQSISIREFRGIRDLTLDLGGKTFAICGPNGTGKSGIVDALEFALTGNISRLAGTGTGGLSVKEHGPHVDSRNKPENASVSLTVHIPSLKKNATIVRTVKDSKNPKLTPDDPDVRAILAKVALHPEFTLSRRELIKYVLAEPGKRSKEVQELLRLDEVESLRSLFQKIANASERDLKIRKVAREEAMSGLLRALNLPKLSSSAILVAANEKRALLFLPAISALEANTSIKDGIVSATSAAGHPIKIAKVQAKSDIDAIRTKLASIQSPDFLSVCSKVAGEVSNLSKDEQFLQSASKEALLQTALSFFDDESCPVCDTPWKSDDFRQNLAHKLEHYAAATKQRKQLEQKLLPIINELESLKAIAASVARYGVQLQPAVDCGPMNEYVAELAHLSKALRNFLPLSITSDALAVVSNIPEQVHATVTVLDAALAALPEPTQQDAARDFLSVGQERLETYRQASLKQKEAEHKATESKFIFDLYGKVTTDALDAIYKNVEASFSKLYRLINHDDEDKFQAQLKPSIGKLGFDVDFYGRGFFPPGAYHSEGHQDGMGLCLYLALMSHLAGEAFTFAVLDDVLMSVDSGHRREVSKMLREQFPNTQFLLTTHDEIWLRHMKSVGLIEPKRFAHFRTWNVDSGPTEWDDRDVWEELTGLLAKNEVRAGAALLRNYLEHFSKEACQSLRAQVEYRGDAQFTLGGLLPNAIGKMKKHLKAGKAAAQSWGQDTTLAAIASHEEKFSAAVATSNVEQWQMNAAVHYNEWANLHKNDFEPVVAAYKSLVEAFSCLKCNSALYATPDSGEAETLRCSCGDSHVNLLRKSS
jgi:hypothetical protein